MLSGIAATGLGLALALVTPSTSFAAAGATGAGATEGVQEPTPGATGAEQCRALDFEEAAVAPVASTGSVPPSIRYRLTVGGTKPASNVTVRLVPAVYVRQPNFWAVQVTGCSSGIGLPVLMSYTATYDFTGPKGICGIEVIGTTKKQQFDLAGCGSAPLAGSTWVLDPAGLGVPLTQGTAITAHFSDVTVSGNTSCNAYQAEYRTATGGAFTVGPIAMTARACDPATTRAESAFLVRLTTATQLQASGTELRLLHDGTTLLRFTPAGSAA